MANTWLDPDGLYRKYGTTKTVATTAGEYKTFGALREIEVRIDLTTLTSSAVIQNDVTFFPKNVFIEEIAIDVQTAATSSGTGTLDIGLVKMDRSTEIDFNGFIAAETTANLNHAGKKLTYNYGTSQAGALVGATSGADVGYITANYNTGAFQTGVIFVRIRYRTTS